MQGGDHHKPEQPQAGKNPGASSKIGQFDSAAVGFDPTVQFHQKVFVQEYDPTLEVI